jgi:serine/threonine protein kinase
MPLGAKSLFLAASDFADPAERAAYLDRECGGGELRARVEALLRANDDGPPPERTGPFTPDGPARDEAASDPTACVGATLAGRYKLVQEIGEGGMGAVFMAQQTEPVRRAVAVKVIKAGMDSKAVLARFEAERQALAMMDHPNIARVLDAGTTDSGRPFFVMELVKGVPITQFCDDRKLTPRQRLELFVPVCQALQHAHQKGVIHRDIKPTNVLVAMYDDRPVPKVIDFGVAKAAGQPLTDKTLMTGFGTVVGTPEYMSPEQASFNQLDVDTRSDVYALGVLLYELLTGSTPINRKSLGKAALLEILRIVREVEAPRPSTRLSSAEALPSIAANRGTEPAKLAKLLRGELDWVVLKALEKDRTRRYETANALARDVQRYLADELVEARPPRAGYRLRKFVKRHKGQVVAASLVLVALLAGIAGTTVGMIQARNKEAAAVQARNDLANKNTELEQAQTEVVNKNTALEQSQTELVQKNTALEQSQDQLEGALARTWLSPLVEASGPLNSAEIVALTNVASHRNDRLSDRFLTEALSDRAGIRRLRARSPIVLHAVVGLDPRKRQEVERRLVRALEAPDLPEESRTDLALAVTALDQLAPASAAVVARTLVKTLSKTNDPDALPPLARALSAVAARLEPKEAACASAEAAATLNRAISKTNDHYLFQILARALSAVAARLEPKEAGEAAATLTLAITKTNDPNALRSLAEALSAVAARLEPKEAGEAAATLTLAISKRNDPIALSSLAEALSAVAARLEPKEAREAAATLSLAMTKTNYPIALRFLAVGLSAVAARLEPKEGARVSAEAAATLNLAISKTNDPNALFNLAHGLWAVAARLESKGAGEAAATLTLAISKTHDPSAGPSLAQALSGMAARLEPKEAAEAAATLNLAISKTNNPIALWYLARALSVVAARLEPKEAARVSAEAAAALNVAMTKTNDHNALLSLAEALSAVAARLEPKDAGEAGATLNLAMSKTNDPNALLSLEPVIDFGTRVV